MPGLGAAGAQVRDWKKWRWPMRIALLALIVNLAGLNVQWMRMKNEAKAITLGMTQTFKAAFPKEPVSSDVAMQMRQNIERAKARQGQVTPEEFTYMAAAFAEALRALPRAPELASLAYRERAMTIKIKPGTDAGVLPQLQQALRARKLELSESGAGVWLLRSTGGKK